MSKKFEEKQFIEDIRDVTRQFLTKGEQAKLLRASKDLRKTERKAMMSKLSELENMPTDIASLVFKDMSPKQLCTLNVSKMLQSIIKTQLAASLIKNMKNPESWRLRNELGEEFIVSIFNMLTKKQIFEIFFTGEYIDWSREPDIPITILEQAIKKASKKELCSFLEDYSFLVSNI